MTQDQSQFTNLTSFDVTQDFYGQAYFEGGKQLCETGYDNYSGGQWVEKLAGLVREFIAPRSVIDIGCARGYVVERLRQAGIVAYGSDYSYYALQTAPSEVKPLLTQADATALPYHDKAFEAVLCVETLEHLYPHQIPVAARELARIAQRWVVLSMPTFGDDIGGARGIPIEDPEHLVDAAANRPFRKLILDPQGNPHHGHLTLATWRWWTEQFEAVGLQRQRWLEQLLVQHCWADPDTWHFYIFAQPGVVETLRQQEVTATSIVMTPCWLLGSGWHTIDDVGGRSYRWTSTCATVDLHYHGQRWLVIELAGGPHTPVIELRANGQSLGRFPVEANWHILRVELPATLSGQIVVELSVDATFVPAQIIDGSVDGRELGVMVSRIVLE